MVLALAGARKVVGIDRNDTGEIETAARRAVGFGFRMRDDPRGIRLDLEFVIGDAVCLDKKFTRGLFTVVVSTLLWNNLERGKQLHAQQLWRVLTPGGKLILESREPGVDPLDIFEARTKFPTLHRFFKFGPIVASHIPQWAVRRTATGRRRAGWAEVLVGVGVRRSRPLPRIHRG